MTQNPYQEYKATQKNKTTYKDREMNINLMPIVRDNPNGSIVIDVGCGNGRLMNALKVKGCTVTGFDIASPAVALAKTYGLTAYVGDVDNPDETLGAILDEEYHIATFCKSLIYIQYPHYVIKRTKPNIWYV